MQKVVLIGENIGHSLSPEFQNYLYRRYDVALQYELMPLALEEVIPVLRTMKRGGYRGANITSPFKETVIAELDEIDDTAAEIGAVNTILFEHGRAIGYNTDGYGFAWSLRNEEMLTHPFTAGVMGTGGAALAAIRCLLGYSDLTSLTLYSRDALRAGRIAGTFDDSRVRGRVITDFKQCDLLVHATPVGLRGNPGKLLSTEQLRGVALLYEMIYLPANTELAEAARAAGARVISGIDMFIGQAVRSFELWTGVHVLPEDIPGTFFSHSVPSA